MKEEETSCDFHNFSQITFSSFCCIRAVLITRCAANDRTTNPYFMLSYFCVLLSETVKIHLPVNNNPPSNARTRVSKIRLNTVLIITY
jgi:hypothetical protein